MRKRIGYRFHPTVELFDPCKGEDFCIPYEEKGNILFSSRDHGCAVIRMTWMRGWWVKRIPVELLDPALVHHVLQNTGARGFLGVRPKEAAGTLAFLAEPMIHQYGEAVATHFPHNEQTVACFLRALESRGAYGEWFIGSGMYDVDPFDVEELRTQGRSPDLLYFLARFSTIGSVCAFDLDSGEFFAAFRTFDGYQDVISDIVGSLQGSQL